MKPGVYKVQGNSGPDKTEAVEVLVSETTRGEMHAVFTFRGSGLLAYCHVKGKPLPERVAGSGLPGELAPVARSIAKAAFSAAFSASVREKEEADKAAHDALDDDDADPDALVFGAMRNRSAGPAEGRYTKHSS